MTGPSPAYVRTALPKPPTTYRHGDMVALLRVIERALQDLENPSLIRGGTMFLSDVDEWWSEARPGFVFHHQGFLRVARGLQEDRGGLFPEIVLRPEPYTFCANYVGHRIVHNSAESHAYVIPTYASKKLPIGATYDILNVHGSGLLILQPEPGVALRRTNGTSLTGSIGLKANRAARIYQYAEDQWYVETATVTDVNEIALAEGAAAITTLGALTVIDSATVIGAPASAAGTGEAGTPAVVAGAVTILPGTAGTGAAGTAVAGVLEIASPESAAGTGAAGTPGVVTGAVTVLPGAAGTGTGGAPGVAAGAVGTMSGAAGTGAAGGVTVFLSEIDGGTASGTQEAEIDGGFSGSSHTGDIGGGDST